MPFEAIYREHFAFVWRSLLRMGVAERDAADAAQEVFMIAYQRQDSFDTSRSLRAWLFGIAYRVAARRRRLASSRLELLVDTETAATATTEPAQQTELRELLRRGLDALPLEQRAVLILFELEGFSGEEIAELLNLPEGTVRSRLRLARAGFSRAVRRANAVGSASSQVEAAHDGS